jgi:hypothetical protein
MEDTKATRTQAKVKGPATLFKFVKAVGTTEYPALEQQKIDFNFSCALKDIIRKPWKTTPNMGSFLVSPECLFDSTLPYCLPFAK